MPQQGAGGAPPKEVDTDRAGAGQPGAAPPPDRSGRRFRDRPLTDATLALATAAVTLPLLWMGYGTDIDVANVLEATDTIRSGDYEPSRTPGVPVVEAVVALLDPIGGHVLVNLATASAAAALVVGIARLVRSWGHDNGDLVALAFLASPVTIIASTSLADFVWALAFFVWGAVVHLGGSGGPGRRSRLAAGLLPDGRALAAGVLFGLAIGSRMSTGLVIVAFLVADGWDPAHRVRGLRTAAVALPVGAALYVPSWLAFDRSLAFLETTEGYRGLLSNLGLFLYKNYAMAGIALGLVVLVAAPALVRALPAWNRDPMLRFAVLALLVTEGLFFQLPWKLAHLLPCLLAALLWLGASERGRQRRFLWVVVAAVAVNGVVTFRPLSPDDPDEATAGTWNPAVTAGLLLNDIDCRAHFMHLAPTEPTVRDAWACTLEPLRGPAGQSQAMSG